MMQFSAYSSDDMQIQATHVRHRRVRTAARASSRALVQSCAHAGQSSLEAHASRDTQVSLCRRAQTILDF